MYVYQHVLGSALEDGARLLDGQPQAVGSSLGATLSSQTPGPTHVRNDLAVHTAEHVLVASSYITPSQAWSAYIFVGPHCGKLGIAVLTQVALGLLQSHPARKAYQHTPDELLGALLDGQLQARLGCVGGSVGPPPIVAGQLPIKAPGGVQLSPLTYHSA